MLDRRTIEAKRRAVEDGLMYQRNPTPETFRQYQKSSTALLASQQCAHTDTWHKFINSINLQTNVESMRGKTTAPGDDGITYSNLLQLCNPCLRHGYMPQVTSLIVPIPKPDYSNLVDAPLLELFAQVFRDWILMFQRKRSITVHPPRRFLFQLFPTHQPARGTYPECRNKSWKPSPK
ncbi:hypothetical protein SK128_002783 [Halocaridina rubra]|uniref:Uncharacterized protein n=1 Tax=Halocaridina rubra TaxID=373956 RepID=A0AAN8WY11_HALRR